MTIAGIRIRNFRGIKELDLELGRVTILVGENNSGKTSVLEALKLCLKDAGSRHPRSFKPLDFHLADESTDPAMASPIEIEIELTFAELSSEKRDKRLEHRLNRLNVLQSTNDRRRYVRMRVACQFDPEENDFVQTWSFLGQGREALDGLTQNGLNTALREIRQEVQIHYLSTLRDAARNFGARGEFWRPFLRDSQLSDEKRSEILQELQAINDLIVSSHGSFEQVKTQLSQLHSFVPVAGKDAVSIEALPSRMLDILSRTQVQIGSASGAKIPLVRHGEGTQSLSVLMLFSAFLQAQAQGTALLALEEPEAHLHPSAVRNVWNLLKGIGGQKVISTHSGELLAETSIYDIRRLARTRDGIKAFQVPAEHLSAEEVRKFNNDIRRTRGELLFARCWLLVEGQTEAWIFPAAARALGINLHADGIRIVESRQSDEGMLAKVANALGIAWFCVGDRDENRNKVKSKLEDHLNGADEEDRFSFPYPNIEVNLLQNGFKEIYMRHVRQVPLKAITAEQGTEQYWVEVVAKCLKGRKTKAAAEVADAMESKESDGVPEAIRRVLEKVRFLATDGHS